ncbi:hypothetical protein M3221_22150 [Domibacillus indicus]|uniref:hypothetical protein n=1 Tax=Domibacillus indicus TaxID=1437523 RepID=UPI00203BE91D|nr:hypothetical protein [Domibacillus indicus]MCM3791046.1 hypothetical protein [Domibacillus indicus]
MILISGFIVLMYTVFFALSLYPVKQQVSAVSGKCIVMAFSMVTATLIGLLLAFSMQGQLAASTILSIVMSGIFAYIIGRPFGLMGITEALMSGFMGGMMGAMLGEMIPVNQMTIMIAAMDLFYFFTAAVIITMIRREVPTQKEGLFSTRRLPFALLTTLSICIIGGAALFDSVKAAGSETEENVQADDHHNH